MYTIVLYQKWFWEPLSELNINTPKLVYSHEGPCDDDIDTRCLQALDGGYSAVWGGLDYVMFKTEEDANNALALLAECSNDEYGYLEQCKVEQVKDAPNALPDFRRFLRENA